MRDGLLPAVLLCAAFGFVLGAATPRTRWVGLALLCPCTFGASFLPALHPELFTPDRIFIACWSILLFVAGYGLCASRLSLPMAGTLALAVLAGAGAGAVFITSAPRVDGLYVVSASLLCFLARWLIKTKRRVVLNVLQGWLIAIALLGISLPLLIPTPGYAPDHRE
jgi:hypothetical protein